MRRLLLALLLLAISAQLCACGQLEDYLSVKPHVEPSISDPEPTEAELPPVVTNSSELRGTVLSFIRSWVERGTITVADYEGDLSADLAETMHYATKDDPIGAYAVDYADAELLTDTDGGRSIEISIVFRRSAAEIDSIVTVSGNTGARDKIRQALTNFDTALTLRIRNYEETDFTADMRRYCLENPATLLALPEVSADVYPQEGETRVLELHFTYPHTRDEMRAMLASVNTILNSAAAYIRGGETARERAELLFRFLTVRIDYTVAEEMPAMPAYSLLKERQAHSSAFASVFYAECTRAEIDCAVVEGTLNGQTRYWNSLKLDGQTYYVDLMRSIELDETELTLLTQEEMAWAGYVWTDMPEPL